MTKKQKKTLKRIIISAVLYLAIILALVLAFFLSKTKKGLNLRAVGESPATADAAGINVTVYKYLATCIGGGISGLGGLLLCNGVFRRNLDQ